MWPELWAYGIAELGHSLVRPKELEAEATNETYAEVGHRAGERADMQSEDHSPITITKPHQPHYHYWVPIGVRAEEGVGTGDRAKLGVVWTRTLEDVCCEGPTRATFD